MRLDLLLEITLAFTTPLDLAGQDQLAAGPLCHLDRQGLALVRGDAGDLDQVTLVGLAGRRRWHLDGVVNDAGQPQERRAGGLAQADGTEPDPIHHLLVEGTHRLEQLAVNGMDDHWRDPAVERHQYSFVAAVVVDDVEALSLEGVVDPGEVRGVPSALVRPTEVAAPVRLTQHRDVRHGAGGAERRHLVAQPAKLGLKQVHDQLDSTVAAGR